MLWRRSSSPGKSWLILRHFGAKELGDPELAVRSCFPTGAPSLVSHPQSIFAQKKQGYLVPLMAETISSRVKPWQRTAGLLVRSEHFSPPARDHP